jgi:hypothetical protein
MDKSEVAAGISALEKSITTLDTCVLVFAAFVAVGVVGEAILGVRHWILDGRLQGLRHIESQLHENELAQLTKDTALANQELSKANERTAALENESEQLRRDTAEATARALEAQLELKKFKAPRTLSAEQQSRIAKKLMPFGHDPVDFLLYGVSPESQALIGVISQAVNQSKRPIKIWEVVGGAVPGVLVLVAVGASDQANKMADALVEALQAEGIQCKKGNAFSPADWPNQVSGPTVPPANERASIRVLVGTKP